jgi:hypothetical protein
VESGAFKTSRQNRLDVIRATWNQNHRGPRVCQHAQAVVTLRPCGPGYFFTNFWTGPLTLSAT